MGRERSPTSETLTSCSNFLTSLRPTISLHLVPSNNDGLQGVRHTSVLRTVRTRTRYSVGLELSCTLLVLHARRRSSGINVFYHGRYLPEANEGNDAAALMAQQRRRFITYAAEQAILCSRVWICLLTLFLAAQAPISIVLARQRAGGSQTKI